MSSALLAIADFAFSNRCAPWPILAPCSVKSDGIMEVQNLCWLGLVVVTAACTRPNPAVCCLDQADCNEVGISDPRACSAGLACVDHECVVPSAR